jgi:hypothetical protein
VGAWLRLHFPHAEPRKNQPAHGIISNDSTGLSGPFPERRHLLMALTSSTPHRGKPRGARRAPLAPLLVMGAVGGCAVTVVAYLLWPTWHLEKAGDPSHLPISIGNTLFNVPTKAVRIKVQKRTGPQERVDLNLVYPSLEPPEAPRHVSAETVEDNIPEIDRIFLSIAAHHDSLSPDDRTRTIYPRYFDPNSGRLVDGLSTRAFRDNTPYANEDLVYAGSPQIIARCTRDGKTPGMCLAERRIEGADVTFRFPRAWLAQWRDVANAMDQIISRMRNPRGQAG